jgi:hypothetical protein
MEEQPQPPQEPTDATHQAEGAEAGADAHTQEELRQQIEEQLGKLRVQDLLLESVAGILNLTARRIAKEDERDLEQARVGIDAVRAVLELIEPEEAQRRVREALSELQLMYARESEGEGEAPARPPTEEARDTTGPTEGEGRRPPGLWVPPGSG